ncbi:MAG: sulfurtransferase TusA family protein [Firmicutes bacterium]|nr:sulfurtransferase TusA family protein [Bacillota bacterium]
MNTLDARGLSCPEPVVMIRKAMQSKENAYRIVVDNTTATENISRFVKNQGYNVVVTQENGDYVLDITK